MWLEAMAMGLPIATWVEISVDHPTVTNGLLVPFDDAAATAGVSSNWSDHLARQDWGAGAPGGSSVSQRRAGARLAEPLLFGDATLAGPAQNTTTIK
jgi:hypothetical protein